MDLEKMKLLRSMRNEQGVLQRHGGLSVFEQQLATELLCEQASSLGRAGRRLEAACRSARDLYTSLGPDPSEERRIEYRELREIAVHARWKMVVQREAIGLRDHRDLDRVYALPPRLS